MRVIADKFANIDNAEGERLHTQVRTLRDDQNRVAVFLNPNQGPQHVYNLADVSVTMVGGGGCSHPVCHGKASKPKLARLWEQSERQDARAG